MAQSLGAAYVAIRGDTKGLKQDFDGAKNDTTRFVNGMQSQVSNLKRIMIAGFAGWGLKELGQSFLNAGLSAQKMELGLKAATGSSTAAASASAFLRNEADRLGLSLLSAEGAFVKIAAASKGTALEGENTRLIFTAVSEAATALQLSSGEAEGALYAISQMMSKGTVQAEELRGQLGERLPGAFNIAAQAMGVSTAALNKMLEQGQVISEEFLPKFAKALHDKFAKPAEDAADSLQANLNRAGNSWTQLQRTVMDSEVMGELSNSVSKVAEEINKWVKANDDLIKQGVHDSIDKIKASVDTVVTVYNSIPSEITGAAGAGIIGRVLFGGWGAAKLLAAVSLINGAFETMKGLGLGDFTAGGMVQAYKEAVQAVDDLTNAIIRFYKEQTGAFSAQGKISDILVDGYVNISKSAEEAVDSTRTLDEVVKEMTKSAARAYEKMEEDIATASSDTTDKKRKQLNYQYQKYFEATGDILAVDRWYASQIKILDEEIAKDRLEAQEKLNKDYQKAYENMLKDLQDKTSDILYDWMVNGWGDVLETMKNLFYRFAAEVAAKQLVLNVGVPALNGLGISAGSAGSGFLSNMGGSIAGKVGLSALTGGATLSSIGIGAGGFEAAGAGIAGIGGIGTAGVGSASMIGGIGLGTAALGIGAIAAIAVPIIMGMMEKTAYGEVSPGSVKYDPASGGLAISGFDVLEDNGMGGQLKEAVDSFMGAQLENFNLNTERLKYAIPELTGKIDSALADFSVKLAGEYASGFEGFSVSEKDDIAKEFDRIVNHAGDLLEGEADAFAEKLGYETYDALMVALQEFEAAMASSASSIGSAFKSSLVTGDFETFEKTLNDTIYNTVLDGFVSALMNSQAIQRALQPFFVGIDDAIGSAFDENGTFNPETFKSAVNPLIEGAKASVTELKPLFDSANDVFKSLKDLLPGVSTIQKSDTLPAYQFGGRVPNTGAAWLHRGEEVITAENVAKLDRIMNGGSAGPGPVNFTIRVNDPLLKKIIRIEADNMNVNRIRRGLQDTPRNLAN